MLDKAFAKIPNAIGLIKGNCLDNSVMENFFGLLKSKMFYKYNFNSVQQFDRRNRIIYRLL